MSGNSSRGESSFDLSIYEKITMVWMDIDLGGDCGRTNWEALVPLRDSVTAALSEEPRDLDEAMRLTALALMLIDGTAQANDLP